MKWSLLVLPLLFFSPLAAAATRAAATCSQSDVQSAINAAADGDIVSVPAGACTWSSSVVIDNKNITLKGAGHGCSSVLVASCTGQGTNITVNSTVGIAVYDDTKPFRITGFRFNRSNSMNTGTILIDKHEAYRDNKNATGWRIDNIFFNGSVRHVMIYGVANYGLVDHSYFHVPGGSQTFQYRARGTGESDGISNIALLSGTKARNLPLSLGTADALYIEDNEFYDNRWGGAQNVGDGTAGYRVVVRHNIIRGLTVEVHGACSGRCRGGLQWEIYENDFYPYNWDGTTGDQWAAIRPRAGTGVIFNNRFYGKWNATAGEIFFDNQRSKSPVPGDCGFPMNARCDGTSPMDGNIGFMGYPCLDQVGRGTGPAGNQATYPALIWGNIKLSGGTVVPKIEGNSGVQPYQSDHLKLNREWCMPACSGSSCTATCNGVSQSYTAFTYPHPLQSSGSGTTTPRPPQNLRVIP